ncbi:MAG TPA: formate dehydrogenase accessory sulfurtransferase FdhD [Woeseiaceae bacterium]|nr:formate dehydrogenase accessory sulfurtransferase FdhD [Woeseiaceae bacterium]
MPGGSLAIDVSKVHGPDQVSQSDSVAVEEPLEIQLCAPSAEDSAAKSISITMRTPGNDEELALGFLFTEGIITSLEQVSSAMHCGPEAPDTGYRNVIRIELNPGAHVDLTRLERHFYTTSSCGVCGKSSLDALRVSGQQPMTSNTTTFDREVIVQLPDKLRVKQEVFATTGGLHAAAAFTPDGDISLVREDVGRHNAVDKIVGALLKANQLPAQEMGLLVSGRASFELMQKALVAGFPLLAAVGAPSSLAVSLAREFDMTLVGFLRRGNFNIYSREERLA